MGQGKVRDLWGRLRERIANREDGPEALEHAAQSEAPDRFDDLAYHLRMILGKELGLAAELDALLPELLSGKVAVQAGAHAQVAAGDGINQAGGQSTIVGRSVYGGMHVYHANCPITPEMIRQMTGGASLPVDLVEARAAYLKFLSELYWYLELRGMNVKGSVGLKLTLLNLFIPLEARQVHPEGETWTRELMVGGRKAGDEEKAALGERLTKPRALLRILRETAGLIILGDPGSGKTTFLKYLCLQLACGHGSEIGLDGYLPVMLPLSAYAEAGGGKPLEDFIADYYANEISGNHPMRAMLRQALTAGRALLLLDGLDEIRDPIQRRGVVDSVARHFAAYKSREPGNRFVLTSRIVGYREVQPQQTDMAECTLVDFTREDMIKFIEQWTGELERSLLKDLPERAAEQAAEERLGLFRAIDRSESVRKLAANPLLLTILCLMKRQGIELPERRIELYQHYVHTLIYHWNLGRGLRRRDHSPPQVNQTIKILAPLALWMQETSPGKGLVEERKLLQCLAGIVADEKPAAAAEEAERFLADIREETGLLIDRGGHRFGFIHLTFMEYLAAVGIVRLAPESIDPIFDYLTQSDRIDQAGWREVWMLTLGYLSLDREQAASRLLERLVAEQPGPAGAALVRAGEALLDMGNEGTTPYSRQQVLVSLAAGMREQTIPARQRVACGRLLGGLGGLPATCHDPDAMPFCWVPAGPFVMGSDDDDPDAYDDEKKAHRQPVDYGYWLAKWPVTAAQFQRFVEESGYEKHDNDSLNESFGAPVARVSWHDAIEFCRWLDIHWREKDWLPEGYHVGLPSELEWEKAARGGEQLPAPDLPAVPVNKLQRYDVNRGNDNSRRTYPWGDEASPEWANYKMYIGNVSPVGCYPLGASPYGCEEMSGNVWEWTRSLWEGQYPYPQTEEERRNQEDPAADDRRVLRGGSFLNTAGSARCACRDHFHPRSRGSDLGFRVVLSPFALNSEGSGL